MTRRVLLVANHPAFNKNMLRWAHVLQSSGAANPVLFSTTGSLAPAIAQMELRSDLRVIHAPAGHGWQTEEAPAGAPAGPARRGWIRSLLKGPLESAARTAYTGLRVAQNMRELRGQLRFITDLVRQEGIDALVLSESSPAYGATVFVQAARAAGIPVVSIPIEHYGAGDHAELYLTDEVLNADRGLKRWVASRYPRWAVTHKGTRMLRIRLDLLLAYQWMGWASSMPWHMVGAWEDAVAVTGLAMRDFYLGEGLDMARLRVIGSPELDLMTAVRAQASTIRSRLLGELGLDADKPIILTAMVANHYLAGRPDAEYETYKELVEGWIKPLAAMTSHNVIVNLHPSQRIEDYRYIEEWGVRICQKDITTLVPLSDIFVACSSTSRLAIACGIPLVYYDVFRYSSAMPTLTFPNAGGTVMVTTQRALIETITKLTTHPEFYAGKRERQQASAPAWGSLDGRSAERFAVLMESLITNKTAA